MQASADCDWVFITKFWFSWYQRLFLTIYRLWFSIFEFIESLSISIIFFRRGEESQIIVSLKFSQNYFSWYIFWRCKIMKIDFLILVDPFWTFGVVQIKLYTNFWSQNAFELWKLVDINPLRGQNLAWHKMKDSVPFFNFFCLTFVHFISSHVKMPSNNAKILIFQFRFFQQNRKKLTSSLSVQNRQNRFLDPIWSDLVIWSGPDKIVY